MAEAGLEPCILVMSNSAELVYAGDDNQDDERMKIGPRNATDEAQVGMQHAYLRSTFAALMIA